MIPPSVNFVEATEPDPNFIYIVLGPSELFTLRGARTPRGPWEPVTEGASETIMVEDPRLEAPVDFEVWAVPIAGDAEAQYWRAELDWEKILGEPVD